jgi:hypothetical protein
MQRQQEFNITATTNNIDNNSRCIAGNEIKAVDDDYIKNCYCPKNLVVRIFAARKIISR